MNGLCKEKTAQKARRTRGHLLTSGNLLMVPSVAEIAASHEDLA